MPVPTYPWRAMDIHAPPWVLFMTIHGYPWTSMEGAFKNTLEKTVGCKHSAEHWTNTWNNHSKRNTHKVCRTRIARKNGGADMSAPIHKGEVSCKLVGSIDMCPWISLDHEYSGSDAILERRVIPTLDWKQDEICRASLHNEMLQLWCGFVISVVICFNQNEAYRILWNIFGNHRTICHHQWRFGNSFKVVQSFNTATRIGIIIVTSFAVGHPLLL